MPGLTVTSGVDEGKHFELPDEAVCLGRESTCGIRLFDTEVSRRHVEIRPHGRRHLAVDLGSVNGLFINGRPMKSVELQDGDRLQVGATVLRYHGIPGPRMAPHGDFDLPSAIVSRMASQEGSRILSQAGNQPSSWLATRLANLNILYEAIRAVSHILDMDQLLSKVLELLFRSIDADRGCILVREADGAPLNIRASHGRISGREFTVSTTIVDHVLLVGEGIVVSDAGADDRFATSPSVVRQGIREAICAPLTGRHGTVGVLYFDTFFPTRPGEQPAGRFTVDHLTLAVAVAHQAAIAVEENRHYRALVQAERLAAVGQTIAAVSHHVKNVLQGLKSGGEILRRGITDKDEECLATGWRLIEKNQDRMYDLVQDMLTYAKERMPQREPTDLAALANDVVELMGPVAAERGIAVALRVAELERVAVDREAIHRAILNVVTNALDAAEASENPRVEIEVHVAPGQVVIAVTDNGPGIEPADLPRLFTPFFSTKGGRGTGLGLAVSRKTLREHGGDIAVTSTPGQGTRFELLIPT